MRPIPTELLTGPFTRPQALTLGVSPRMLRGSRFVRVHPRVWRFRDYEMTDGDRVLAASLALPDDVKLTGISRIQQLGLDFGPRLPVRFVVARDLHLALDGVFLHRTVRLPPLDDVGVAPLAAYVSYCSRTRVIDAIKVGDWLLHEGHMGWDDLRAFALDQRWRDGAEEAIWVANYLDGDSRSLRESETRSLLGFAGLPRPEVNVGAGAPDDIARIGDLVYRKWGGVIVEYEGGHHQEDCEQYVWDIDRYAALRRERVPYVQVTREKLQRPRRLVGEVYRELVTQGYDGPPPEFGEHWRRLFARLTDAVGRRRWNRVASA